MLKVVNSRSFGLKILDVNFIKSFRFFILNLSILFNEEQLMDVLEFIKHLNTGQHLTDLLGENNFSKVIQLLPQNERLPFIQGLDEKDFDRLVTENNFVDVLNALNKFKILEFIKSLSPEHYAKLVTASNVARVINTLPIDQRSLFIENLKKEDVARLVTADNFVIAGRADLGVIGMLDSLSQEKILEFIERNEIDLTRLVTQDNFFCVIRSLLENERWPFIQRLNDKKHLIKLATGDNVYYVIRILLLENEKWPFIEMLNNGGLLTQVVKARGIEDMLSVLPKTHEQQFRQIIASQDSCTPPSEPQLKQ